MLTVSYRTDEQKIKFTQQLYCRTLHKPPSKSSVVKVMKYSAYGQNDDACIYALRADNTQTYKLLTLKKEALRRKQTIEIKSL
jgi:hypothetical protein